MEKLAWIREHSDSCWLYLISCQSFVDRTDVVKERQIHAALQSCMEARQDSELKGYIRLASIERIHEAYDYIITVAISKDEQEEELRTFFKFQSKVDISDCDGLKTQLSHGIPNADRDL